VFHWSPSMFLRRRGAVRCPTPFTTPRCLWRTPRRRHTHIVRRCKLEFYILLQHIHTSVCKLERHSSNIKSSREHTIFTSEQQRVCNIQIQSRARGIDYNIQSRQQSTRLKDLGKQRRREGKQRRQETY